MPAECAMPGGRTATPTGEPTVETHNLDLSIPGAIDALLARHKAMYGDAVMMADDGSEAGDSDSAATASSDKPDDAAPDQQDEPLGEPGKRALDSERRLRSDAEKARRAEKDRADAAEAQLEDIRRSQMSDQDRIVAERDDWRTKYETAQAATAEAEKARDAAALSVLRLTVAVEKGIGKHAHRLTGSTREEIEADADAFKADLPADNTPSGNGRYVDINAGRGGGPGSGSPGSISEAMEAYRASRARDRGTSTTT